MLFDMSAAALAVVGQAGLDVGQAALAVASFKSLPHRLQFLGQRDDRILEPMD